jgi:hypothetical protein
MQFYQEVRPEMPSLPEVSQIQVSRKSYRRSFVTLNRMEIRARGQCINAERSDCACRSRVAYFSWEVMIDMPKGLISFADYPTEGPFNDSNEARIVLSEDTILLVPPNTSGESIWRYIRENVDCNGFL